VQKSYGDIVGVSEQSYKHISRHGGHAIETEYFWLKGKCLKINEVLDFAQPLDVFLERKEIRKKIRN
jgi:hypothetical protein